MSVEIFDVAGRLVRGLMLGELAGGRQIVRWDGRDGQGGKVGSGLYLIRVRSGSEQVVKKVVAIR